MSSLLSRKESRWPVHPALLTTIPGWVIVCDGGPFSLPSNRVKSPENFSRRMLKNPIAMTRGSLRILL